MTAVTKPAADTTLARVKHSMNLIHVDCEAIRNGGMSCMELTEHIESIATALVTALERDNNNAVREQAVQG